MEAPVLHFIVLSYTKVGESSLVLHTLSEEYGRRGFIVTVPKGVGMALYLPLNILEAEVIENKKSDLWRLKNIVSLYPLDGIRSDVRKNTMTLFMSEVLFRTVRDGAAEEGLEQWCERSVLTLDALDSDFSNFHLLWLLELCSALGFRPTGEADLAPFLDESQLRAVRSMLGVPYSQALLVPLNGGSRNALASGIIDYLSFHTESSIQIRSLKVLSEVF